MGAPVIHLADLAVLALAGYRITQAVVHDTIGDRVRDRLYAWHAAAPTRTIRAALATLIACIYCAGWWIAGALLATWLLATGQWHQAPLLVHAIEWAAVAGGAVLLNRWDDTRPDSVES